jgi:uncharacterized membrane protein
MISLALLAVVVVFVVAYASTRHRSSQDATHAAAPVEVRSAGLQRWVNADLISEDQARAIAAFEQAQFAARPKPRISPAIEALAYVGGVLLAVGAGMLVGQFWDELGTSGHLALLTFAAVLTGIVGGTVGEDDPVTWRLRGFLWALSTAAVAATCGLFAFEVLDVRGEPVALATAGIGACAAAAYWQLRDRPLQHLSTFVGIAVSVGVAIVWVGGAGTNAVMGLALWLLGAAWAWLAWERRIPPEVVGFPLGVVLTLIASGIVGGQIEWLAPLLGLATAGAWVGLGVTANEPLAVAPGVVGVFVFLPWTLGYFFGESLGAPAITMVSGVILLGIVAMLIRRGRGRGVSRAASGRHFRPIVHAQTHST